MQQIKAAIGEHNSPPVAFLAAKPQNRFRNSKNLRVQRNSMKAHATTSLWLDEKTVYHAGEPRRFRAGWTIEEIVGLLERENREQSAIKTLRPALRLASHLSPEERRGINS
jgi:hypothetical protein